MVQNRSDLAATLSSAFPDATVTMRTQMGGILTSSSAPSVVVITAIAPEAEAFVSDMDEKLVDGTWVVDDKRSLQLAKIWPRPSKWMLGIIGVYHIGRW